MFAIRANFRPSRVFQSAVQQRFLSNLSPTALAGIETRWAKLPEAEQGAIADKLYELQKGDWKNMTLEQKRAAYYIAYGSYGARTPSDPALRIKVASWVAGLIALSVGLWMFWETKKPALRTTTKEWIEAQDQLAIERKQNPFSGAYAKVLKAEAEAEQQK
eukprot:jgi/Hompol1/5/HPOL_000587-RA